LAIRYFIFVILTCHYSAFAQTFQWVQEAGGLGQDAGRRVATDNSGNVYVTGYFSGSASFDGTDYRGKGIFDIFLAKYNSNGGLIWVQTAGSGQSDEGYGLGVDNSGNVYVAGYYTETATFGKSEFSDIQTITSKGRTDIFLAKYDQDGKLIWLKSAGGTGEDKAHNLVVDKD